MSPVPGVGPLPMLDLSDRIESVPQGVADRIVDLGTRIESLKAQQQDLADLVGMGGAPAVSRLEVLHGYLWVFVVAFVVTLLATPLMRRLAIANGVIDHPSDPRKVHRVPIAYMGGVAVFMGLIAGILYSYLAVRFPNLIDWHPTQYATIGQFPDPVRPSIVLGMFVIMMVGLLDDILKISPRIKIAGQLVAAAALAIDDVGTHVAKGVLTPIGKALFDNSDLLFTFQIPESVPLISGQVSIDLIYWTGTAIIALFVLGACNASNLIDGLDGLLTGTTAICTLGLLIIALGLAVADDGVRDAQRIVLCLAVLGACLGFLPHNFNPATIFLGDAGSLLLGFCTIVIILSLAGERGWTYLVIAGLVCYSIPIIDTVLAIIRRKLAGRSISEADDQHLHHILKRMLGVKGAVFSLYGIGIGFAALGIAMSFGRPRAIYALTLVFAAFIVVAAIKIARKKQLGL
jgi:UDP-GlcNAc:undecaprenyl-phosphate GlcNAc-1-phosphate transferase